MIVGIGVDLCMIDRIERVIARFGERFLTRAFTDIERDYAERFSGMARVGCYAKRWAAKEACAKALGTGFAQGVGLRDVSVVNGSGGAPQLTLAGEAAAALERLTPPGHVAELFVSLSDDAPFAFAQVMIQVVPNKVSDRSVSKGYAGLKREAGVLNEIMKEKEKPVQGTQETDGKLPGKQATAKRQETWGETFRWFAGMIVIMLALRTFVFALYQVPSGSMIPTLQVGDFVMASKSSYGYSRFSMPFSPSLFRGRIFGSVPHRGDIAIFRFTRDTSIDYVKRIIGLPGDRIQMVEGKLYLNGLEVPRHALGHYQVIDENGRLLSGKRYREDLPGSGGHRVVSHDILKLTDTGFPNDTPEYVVPRKHFFAMGDDRDDSADSRFQGDGPDDLGFVPMENLVGRTPIVIFSIDLKHPWWQVWYWPTEIRWGRILHLLK